CTFVLTFPPAHRDLPSFPTRRSSDLRLSFCMTRTAAPDIRCSAPFDMPPEGIGFPLAPAWRICRDVLTKSRRPVAGTKPEKAARSEEHTSELQSRENLVCRLLLEKKK